MGGGNKFIDDAAIGFELAFVPLKGVKCVYISEEMGGRVEGVRLVLLQPYRAITRSKTTLLTGLVEA